MSKLQREFGVMMESVNKRIRISRGQSKYGCFTCRARRIKCDEQKPSCAKCQKAKLNCEGYPLGVNADRESSGYANLSEEHESSLSDHLSRAPSLSRTPPGALSMASEQESLMQSGLDLLLRSYCDEHAIGQATLRHLIDQTKLSSPAVKAACAALGAAHELQQNIQRPASHTKLVFETNYGKAITLIKSSIEGIRYDLNAIVAACIVLSAIETILRRRRNALIHIRGAYQALRSGGFQEMATAVSDTVDQYETTSMITSEALTLLRIFDLQTLFFVKSARPAAMDPIPLRALQAMKAEFASSNLIDKQIIESLHASMAHLNTTAHTLIGNGALENIMDDYSQYVALLLSWASVLADQLAIEVSRKQRQHLLILRNLCMSLAIEMQAFVADNELMWDSHALWFQELIASSEEILEYHLDWRKQQSGPSRIGFTPQLAMLQPVYLAALKYREHRWRQRAINCLQRMAREGPWVGQMMAAIAQRTMDLEESFVDSSRAGLSSVSGGHQNLSSAQLMRPVEESISEQARISFHCLVEGNGATDDFLWPSADTGRVAVRMFKRRQPVNMLDVFVLTSTHFGAPETATSHLKHHKLDMDNWMETLEEIDFGPSTTNTVARRTVPLGQVPRQADTQFGTLIGHSF